MKTERRFCVFLALTATLGCASDQGARDSSLAVNCEGAVFREFDFWLGEWEIEQRILSAEGGWIDLPAKTRVASSADGCVITENWSGEVQFFWEGMTTPEPIWGYSARRYDPREETWAIFWMDGRNPYFAKPMVGGFEDGRGEFFRDDGDNKRARIVFDRRGEDRIFWELAISSGAGADYAPIWTMDMRRAD